MKAVLKFLGFTLAFLATLAIALVIYIGWLFDPNDYKDLLEATVEERTGRDFAIEDDLSLSFFPPIGIETGGLTLGNAEGFGEEPFAVANRAVLRVKVWPLFFGRVELGNFEIDGLRLNLARNASNAGNWEGLRASAGDAETTVSPVIDEAGSRLRDLTIEGIVVRDGLIFWREDTSEVRYIVSDLSVETGPILIGQPVRADVDFQLVGVEPQFTARLDTSVIALVNPASSRYLAENLRIGFYLEDGRHEERAAGSFESTVSLDSREMILTFTESQLEASLRNPPLGPESLQVGATWQSGELDLRQGTASVAELSTNTNGILATWEVAGSDLIDAPAIAGRVEVIDESLGAAIDLLGLPVDDGRDRSTLGGFDFSAEFAARPLTREIGLSAVSLSALGMELSGEVDLDANGDGSGRVDLPRFDPRQLLALFPAESFGGIEVGNLDALALTTEFALDGDRQQAAFRNASATLAGLDVEGNFDYFRAERRIEGTIATNEIDATLVESLFPEVLPPSLTPERLGTLRLDSGFAFDTVTDELRLSGFDADAVGLHATGDLSVSELRSGAPYLNGAIHIDRFDPRTLFARFDVPPPRSSDLAVFGSAVVDARLDVTAERGNFQDLRVLLDDSTVTGNLSITSFASPEFEFDLAVDRLDVDRYLPPEAEDAQPTATERPVELPTEAMHSLAVNGTVAVNALRIRGLDLESVATNVTIGDGVGVIDAATARLYGGDFDGGVQLDARTGVPELSLEGTAVGLQLDPLVTALRGESAISGTGNFEIELSGIGETFGDALASTAGRVDFSMRDGVVRGFNLGHELCSVYNRLAEAPPPAASSQQFTSYELLRGSTVVTDGIARTSDLQASTSFMNATGRGQLDLTNRDLNFDLVATLTDRIGIAGCNTMDALVGDSMPIRLTGNVAEPTIRPDFREIIRARARQSLQERFNEELRDLLTN
ncbi:MAG TPA: AsmA family protein [Gammaproteobacteria bacterium]